jgi:hypothetical protein
MKAKRLERALENIEFRIDEVGGDYAARVRAQVNAAQARIDNALSLPAKKRAERDYRDLLLELEEATFQDHCIRYRRERDAEQTAAAFARGR